MSFGKRLKDARTAKKLTQVEVADKLGIDDTTISKYENDKSEPDNETLTRLLDLYGVNFDHIHGIESKKPTVSDLELSDDELMRKYNVVLDGKPIDDDIIREVLSYVRARRLTK